MRIGVTTYFKSVDTRLPNSVISTEGRNITRIWRARNEWYEISPFGLLQFAFNLQPPYLAVRRSIGSLAGVGVVTPP